MTATNAPTGFVGLSHLGIVSGIAWASFGRPVIGYDPDAAIVEAIEQGNLPVHEPGLHELLEQSKAWIHFSTDRTKLSACPSVIVSLDVPTLPDNTSDLAPLWALIGEIVPVLQTGVVLVVMSQVPTGFSRALIQRIDKLRPGFSYALYYCVETLVIGNAVRRALAPERFIIGCADPSLPLPENLREGFRSYGCPIIQMGYESAELTKMAINLYLASSVTYANVLADLCASVNADWSEIVPALKSDQRIGPYAYLRPGLGIAGGNLERDLTTLRYLCDRHGTDTTYIDALVSHNAHRYHWALSMLRQYVFERNPVPKLAVWGLTYKKHTRSLKNSPAVRLIQDLGERADVRVWDPVVLASDVDLPAQIMSSKESVLEDADALIIMTDWDEFVGFDPDILRSSMRRPVVIDCVGVMEAKPSRLAGIEYISTGRRPLK
ncbi:MAG: UDP-glucose/GDP-mannose dehydrogenase family protein [Deltaproteobacteria bacterium]|nr:UDP-glucose/GDP-mannose dehydrogenase family protein [Deltaproteobacteria bacterium]